MIRRAALAVCAMLAITCATAACPGPGGKGGGNSGGTAVPTEVEIEWPDAGIVESADAAP